MKSFLKWPAYIIAGLLILGIFGNLISPSDSTPNQGSEASTAGQSKDSSILYKVAHGKENQARPADFNENDSFRVGYLAYRINASFWMNHLTPYQYNDARPDAMFLCVHLSVVNRDTKPRTIPPFRLFDENGSEYETSSKAWQLENDIDLLTGLNPGVQKDGTILFDVPMDHKYKLKVDGGYWSSDYAFVELIPKDGRL